MTKARFVLSSQVPQLRRAVILRLALFAAAAPFSIAQHTVESPASTEAMLIPPESSLPNSPGAVMTSSTAAMAEESADSADPNKAASRPMLRPRVKLVPADRSAPPQTAGDKILMGLRESVTPYSMLGWFFSAGWSHLIDSAPNYGSNSEAFAKRLGAAAAFASSKNISSDSVLGPIFHQDTRYYQLGKGHNIIHRALYAGTRPLIGKTDGGRKIPNFSLMIATAGAAGLAETYYPEKNQGASQVAKNFGSSMGGSAVGALINEFGGDIIQSLHLTRNK